jgi:hypothetical protein
MNAVIFETVVTDGHQLHCALPASLPTGCRLRVVIEPIEGPVPSEVEGNATDPLDWPLTDAERDIWDELPAFRAEHPVRLGSLENAP